MSIKNPNIKNTFPPTPSPPTSDLLCKVSLCLGDLRRTDDVVLG